VQAWWGVDRAGCWGGPTVRTTTLKPSSDSHPRFFARMTGQLSAALRLAQVLQPELSLIPVVPDLPQPEARMLPPPVPSCLFWDTPPPLRPWHILQLSAFPSSSGPLSSPSLPSLRLLSSCLVHCHDQGPRGKQGPTRAHSSSWPKL
jgi:hypothetical protein